MDASERRLALAKTQIFQAVQPHELDEVLARATVRRIGRGEVSSLTGASREKVNRQLRQWEDDGIIGKDGGRLLSMKPQALAPLD